jgi:carboxypeptidase Taq
MGASQFFVSAGNEKPKVKSEIANGNFKPLKEWLTKNVHNKGSLLTPNELFIEATGEPLNVKYYIDQLKKRFLNTPNENNKIINQSALKP